MDQFQHYSNNYSDFSKLLILGEEIVQLQVGREPNDIFEVYGERIFLKMLCHGLSLKKLSPSPSRNVEKELWDVSSCYAIARALIEAFDALSYIALSSAAKEEKEFRLLFWKLHAEARRLSMLEKLGSKHPEVEKVREDLLNLKLQVTNHKCINICKDHIVKGINKGQYQPYHLSQKERNCESGVNHEYFDTVTMHLSSHVHTHPFSVQQIIDFKAGSPECIGLMGIALQYSSVFLAMAITGMIELFSPCVPSISDDLQEVIERWGLVAKNGVKHY